MNLDKLQVNACIRSGWQALDLGLLMARAWWRPLYLAGLLPMLPLAVVLLLVFSDQPFWALFLLWWLKPFWERLPLFIASRLLFSESPGIWSSMKSLPLKDILPWLLWRRFSVQRAFDNPVTVLESQKGAARRERLRVLHGKYSDVALSNQFVSFCCELLLAFGILILLEFFTPDSLGLQLTDKFSDLTLFGEWIVTLAAIAAMSLVMPFHTMAGFALYLNRRIELEAWDIEISFRNLAQRKRSAALRTSLVPIMVMLTAFLVTATPGGAEAAREHDRESATELIGQVMQGEDFGQERTIRKWRFKDWGEDAEETFPEWIIELLEWLDFLWDWDGDGEADGGWWQLLISLAWWLKIILVVAFAALLFYLLRRFRGPLSRIGRRRKPEEVPEILFGLDVTPASLPADVPAKVMQLWAEGLCREALSLLYRASLSRLIDRHQIVFRASHTEAECAVLVRACGIESLSEYFWRLTQVWRRLAYGHRLPASDIVEGLCDEWSRELSSEES
jgi:hypothetical protein